MAQSTCNICLQSTVVESLDVDSMNDGQQSLKHANPIHVHVCLTAIDDVNSTYVRIDLLPFLIDYTGTAPIKQYFNTTIAAKKDADNANAHFEASFRGRRLTGQVIKVPENSTGVLIKASSKNWTAAAKFKELHVWNRDNSIDDSQSLQLHLNSILPTLRAVHLN